MLLKITVKELESFYNESSSFEGLVNSLSLAGYVEEGDSPQELDHVKVFYSIYSAFRNKHYSKSLRKSSSKSKAWALISSIADEAWVFCKDHGFEMRPGFIKFLEVAFENKWTGIKALSMNKYKISQLYEVEVTLLQDPNSVLTEGIYRAYVDNMANIFGVVDDFSDPESYVNFVYASKVAKGLNLQAREYVRRVFEVWEWTKNPISLHQLWGNKTQEYLKSSTEHKSTRVIKKIKLEKGAARWE